MLAAAFSLSTGLYVAPGMAALKNASNTSHALALIAPMQSGSGTLFEQVVGMENTVNLAIGFLNQVQDGITELAANYGAKVRHKRDPMPARLLRPHPPSLLPPSTDTHQHIHPHPHKHTSTPASLQPLELTTLVVPRTHSTRVRVACV